MKYFLKKSDIEYVAPLPTLVAIFFLLREMIFYLIGRPDYDFLGAILGVVPYLIIVGIIYFCVIALRIRDKFKGIDENSKSDTWVNHRLTRDEDQLQGALRMTLPQPTNVDEFEQRVALYRSGSNVPGLLLFVVWMGVIGILSIYETAVFGNDETLTVRFLVGAFFATSSIIWPIFPIKAYIRWRSRKLGLVCPSCNDVLMGTPHLCRHIREEQNCPACGSELFSNV